MLIVFTGRWHGNHFLDDDLSGIQKFHKKPVPRIGGVAVMIGILIVALFVMDDVSSQSARDEGNRFSALLFAALPAFAAGVVEDITKSVSVVSRLLAIFASALLACWLLGATLPRLDIWGVDVFLQIVPVAMVITAVAVAGVANSINIIDGFNGLAGGTAIIILAGIGFLGWQAGDMFIIKLTMAGIGAAVGFLLLNYPAGHLFMGDGGAYLLGFWIAETAVLTIVRNPAINTWQILAICAYPIIEVLFSMYRRKVVQKASVGAPDRLHLHSLVYLHLARHFLPGNQDQPWIRNATVACIFVTWVTPATLLAVIFGDTIPKALALVVIQVFSYLVFYARLVRGHWCFNPAVVLELRPEHRTKSL
jgi:UDP-N-acetylmuramyl pentapeptide phosphotransferase/UDP-N-acetylglucosamine-1-phosphate transferase